MRIAYILTSLGIGGAEKQVLALADRMSARGHTVLLLALRARQQQEWPAQVDVVYLNMQKTPVDLVAGALRARRALGAFKPDVVHSHTYPANMLARMMGLCGAAPRVISTIHNVYEGGRLRMLTYRWTDLLVCHTTAVSTAAAERFIRLKAVPREKCGVLTNGIDTGEFTPDTPRREAMRTQLGAGNDFIWLAAGRITEAKDYPNLIRAFEQVQDTMHETQLWIAGETAAGSRSSDREEPGCFRLKASSSEHDRVRLLGLRRDMPTLLDAADGFVLSSAWEGMPLVIGEAMSMEKQVVATDVGGVRELLGDTGSIVRAKDSAALAAAMLEAMRRPAAGRAMAGRAARQRILRYFSIDSKAAEWEKLYQSLL